MKEILSSHSVVVAAKDQVSCNLEGEVAILSLSKSTYYGLDPIGAQVWNLLQEPRSVGTICDAIVLEYEVEPKSCRDDMLSLLGRLWDEGLIEICENTVAQEPPESR